MDSKLAKLIVAGVVIAAGVRVVLMTRRRAEQGGTQRDDGGLRPATPAASMSRAELNTASRSELYQEAQRLGVRGRSKMTKAQLRAAVTAGGRQ